MPERPGTNPARIVADADVLAADVLVGGAAREAIDAVRGHSWIELVASDDLLDDAEAVIRDLSDADLAAAWREKIENLRTEVEHPASDHPALASAYRGQAAHILSYDEDLLNAKAGAALGSRLNVSAKSPEGFVGLFDAESLYEAVEGGEYPGPDGDTRG